MKKILCGLVLMFAGIAWADTPTSSPSPTSMSSRTSDDCAKQRRANNGQCNIEIEEENLSSGKHGPLDENFHELRAASHGSLIRERANFLPEMVRSLYSL
jgi:hypothetical protein